jgi:cation diffusion facilitator family transporter
MNEDASLAIYASIAANVIIAATKFTAGGLTHSSGMISEAIHSLVDSFDGTLLLLGRHRASRPADAQHPFGHSMELYFWSLIVAVLFFVVGGGLSVYHGVSRILFPEPLQDPKWSYVVLAIAALFDGTSFVIGFRRFRLRARSFGYIRYIHVSKDPSLFTVVLEDTADGIGLLAAFLGIYFGHRLKEPRLDGLASVVIGLVLGAVATVLLYETHGLLIGERASKAIGDSVRELLEIPGTVLRTDNLVTMQLGPRDVLLALDVWFDPRLSAAEVADAIAVFEKQIREAHPEVRRSYLQVRTVSPETA